MQRGHPSQFYVKITRGCGRSFLATGEPTLEKPHDDHVVGQGHRVLVELEGVGVWQRDGEDRHVLVVVEAGEHFG
jgi:hypothetical protein